MTTFGAMHSSGACHTRRRRRRRSKATLSVAEVHKKPFDAHCCHAYTATKHPVPDQIKRSFVIFDTRALWRTGLSVRVPGCQKLQMTA